MLGHPVLVLNPSAWSMPFSFYHPHPSSPLAPAAGFLDVDVAENVIKGIVEGCNQSGCQLLGGETAEMPGFYQKGEYDLAGFATGAVKKVSL